jgi:uncharacterized protein
MRLAAEQDLADAQYSLGVFYLDGIGVEVDGEEAAKWFRLAAAQCFPSALYELGNCYNAGVGVEADIFEAVKWYTKAAGLDCPEAAEMVVNTNEAYRQAVSRIAKHTTR